MKSRSNRQLKKMMQYATDRYIVSKKFSKMREFWFNAQVICWKRIIGSK